MKVEFKQNVSQDTAEPPGWGRRLRPAPAAVAPQASEPLRNEELDEYLDWVAYLDDLARQAREGRDAEARRLVLGKLRFLRRRVGILHEQMMSGDRSRIRGGLETLMQLAEELSQCIQELTGRHPPAVDEWPLPYRLYSRQPVAEDSGSGSHGILERRRRPRAAGNLLSADERNAAWQVVCGIRFVIALVRDGFGMSQHPLLPPVELKLEEALRLM
ncbi:hypothetical protein [uncultured Aquitalea sp.]|uniref:hypothetical protein n=1 Tax=uncultured Aquitalea sp. TaxID=540272 RepID=UPI0025EB24BE|nr:hypothetical protein [uncultured Aquitalea sp.]